MHDSMSASRFTGTDVSAAKPCTHDEESVLALSARREHPSTSREYISSMLIGIAGQARMGKDTLGAMLARHFALETRSFGAAVKRIVSTTFDVSNETIETFKCAKEPAPGMRMPMRRVLQLVGDGFRSVNPNVWVQLALREHTDGVFCDVRYENEARTIRARGGTIVLIGRSSALSDDPNPSEACVRPHVEWFLAHTSEPLVDIATLESAPEAMRMYDWFVRNDDDLISLEETAKRLASGIVVAQNVSATLDNR